jgi:hypothetical protein
VKSCTQIGKSKTATFSHKLTAVLACLLFVCALSRSQTLWDPAGIKVHPDYERVAQDPSLVPGMVHDGELLFRTRFNRLDGAGRPAATGDSTPTPRVIREAERLSRASGPDALSCDGCHNQPIVGGAGDFVANVFVGAHFLDPPTLSLSTELTNERNTLSIIGDGAIEMLAREMTLELRTQREIGRLKARAESRELVVSLLAKGVDFGRILIHSDGTFDQSHLEGIDNDLVVKPFGVKGVAVSLREFSIAALNQHHGIQATERFGWERTGRRDFDEDGVEEEFSIGQVTALVLFQASLPPPPRAIPHEKVEQEDYEYGERLFSAAGCGSCHVPFLELKAHDFTEPNPFNRPGTVTPDDVAGLIRIQLRAGPPGTSNALEQTRNGSLLVRAFSDLKRHKICDANESFFCNEKLRQDNVPTDEFLTAKLWDLAQSAPYGHRGDCDTVSAAILHHGGEATKARMRFQSMPDSDKKALIRFLLTLGEGKYQA